MLLFSILYCHGLVASVISRNSKYKTYVFSLALYLLFPYLTLQMYDLGLSSTDIGKINAHLSRFLPAGFYYKMFIHPRPFWKHVYEPIIRQSAGLGKAPKERDADSYEHFYAFCDVLVVGGGIAGLQAAKAAAQSPSRATRTSCG